MFRFVSFSSSAPYDRIFHFFFFFFSLLLPAPLRIFLVPTVPLSLAGRATGLRRSKQEKKPPTMSPNLMVRDFDLEAPIWMDSRQTALPPLGLTSPQLECASKTANQSRPRLNRPTETSSPYSPLCNPRVPCQRHCQWSDDIHSPLLTSITTRILRLRASKPRVPAQKPRRRRDYGINMRNKLKTRQKLLNQ